MKKLIIVFILILTLIHTKSFGENAIVPKKLTVPQSKKVPEKKEWVKYEPGEGIIMEPLDFTIKPAGTVVLQGSPNPNLADKGKFGTSWVGYLDFQKGFGDWGVAFLRLQPGQNDTIESDLDLFNQVNHNAHDDNARPEATQFWYTQHFFDRQFSITVGKLEQKDCLDVSEYEGNDDLQFLTHMFNKSATIEWPPKHSLGVNLIIKPDILKFIEVSFNYFDARGEWEKIIDDSMFAAEFRIKTEPLLKLNLENKDSNYRFYAWVNNCNHLKLVKEGEAQSSDKESNYGFGFSFDQAVTDVFAFFGRVGWERPDVVPAEDGATIEWAWSAGGQMNGKYWGRKEDALGFAVGQLIASKEYKDAGNDVSSEGHIETYYRFQLNKLLSVGPDLQLIWNPGGVGDSKDNPIFVYGARAHLDF